MPKYKIVKVHIEGYDYGNMEFEDSNHTIQDVIEGKTKFDYKIYTFNTPQQMLQILQNEEAYFVDRQRSEGWYIL